MHEAKSPLRLGVNVDHVATLREARGTLYPDPLEAAKQCVQAGAEGITIHLREDRRHIQDDDVYRLHEALDVPLNLEMAHAPDIVRIALDVKPDEVCLVPERREELTTEGGLDVFRLKPVLRPVIHQLRETGILISLFIEPNDKQLEAAAELEVPYVELHTGTYCDSDNTHVDKELQRLIQGACMAHDLGLNVNAGHGINLDNIDEILSIPCLDTLNIGHSIISRAVMVGLEKAVREIKQAMLDYSQQKK